MDQRLKRKAELYDGFAETREKALGKWAYTEPEKRAEWLIDTLMAINPTQLVEVGCGAGLLAQAWMSRNAHYIGIDISLGMLRLTRGAAPQAVLVRAAAERLPFADKSIACVVADCTIQACVQPFTVLDEIKRVAKNWLGVSVIRRPKLDVVLENELRFSPFEVTEVYEDLALQWKVYVGWRPPCPTSH